MRGARGHDANRGAKLFREFDCYKCHAIRPWSESGFIIRGLNAVDKGCLAEKDRGKAPLRREKADAATERGATSSLAHRTFRRPKAPSQGPQEQQAGDRECERQEARHGGPPPPRCASGKGAAPKNRSAPSIPCLDSASIRQPGSQTPP